MLSLPVVIRRYLHKGFGTKFWRMAFQAKETEVAYYEDIRYLQYLETMIKTVWQKEYVRRIKGWTSWEGGKGWIVESCHHILSSLDII